MRFLLLGLAVFLTGCGTDWDVKKDGYGIIAETRVHDHILQISHESLSHNLTPNPRLAKGERGGEYLVYISPDCKDVTDTLSSKALMIDGFSVTMQARCTNGNTTYKLHAWSKERAIIDINGAKQSIDASALINNVKQRRTVVVDGVEFKTEGFDDGWFR
ncbi:hypothetical protein BCT94_05775 [Vibrio breoganii]|uniref:Lipoprotein n=1 Tax=Vibrio breoganii TaxID=553239 RepID=A0AAP8SY56_9VIBR|nr:hypothetical protein [Vibrio breoganii]PMK78594.1 hypothetical protein BCT94_05775 [Vibrio breoganii]PMP14073.1 hypothetical protein BCS93_04600 [Vibrio breoganii]